MERIARTGSTARRSRTACAAVAAAAAALLAGPAAAEDALGEESRAAALAALEQGDRLRGEARCADAIASWRQGLRETGHWVFLARIGDCYRRDGDHQRAVTYFRRALEEGGDDLPAAVLAEVEGAIGQATAALPATLQVATSAAEAVVQLDGRPLGEGPLAVEAPPGLRLVTAEREGYRSMIVPVRLRSGATASVVVPLEPDEETERAVGPPPEASAPRRTRGSADLLGALLVATGGLLLGGGTWLAAWDGSPIEERGFVGVDAFAPGVGVAALGLGLAVGGIVLLARPPRQVPRRAAEEEEP